MKKKLTCAFILVAFGITSEVCLVASSTPRSFVLDFEGLRDQEGVEDFYNGGYGSLGSGPGADYGVTFPANALALIDSDAGGSGNFGGEPSPDTILFFTVGSSTTMNVAAGFDTGFSLYYSAINHSGSVSVYDGFDGTGNLLATLNLPVTLSDGGDPTGLFSPFYAVGVDFTGIGHSIVFAGAANDIGFDDITFGSSIAGESTQVVNNSRSLLTNTDRRNRWSLDPDSMLGDDPEYTVTGDLPGKLQINGGFLEGFIPTTGVYSFSITGTGNNTELNTGYTIEVVEPTLCPVITAVVVNGVSSPTVIQSAPTHGTPAITELMNLTVSANMELTISFDWDWIKGDYSYKLIRGVMPAGLILDEATGVISGTPTETGEFIFVVSVKDWRGRAYQWIRLVVQ